MFILLKQDIQFVNKAHGLTKGRIFKAEPFKRSELSMFGEAPDNAFPEWQVETDLGHTRGIYSNEAEVVEFKPAVCQCIHDELQHQDGTGPCRACACKGYRGFDG